MNERYKNLCVCLFLTIFEVVQVCNGYSNNTIKEYNNKALSSSAVNRFEDNEIRGEFEFYLKCTLRVLGLFWVLSVQFIRNQNN